MKLKKKNHLFQRILDNDIICPFKTLFIHIQFRNLKNILYYYTVKSIVFYLFTLTYLLTYKIKVNQATHCVCLFVNYMPDIAEILLTNQSINMNYMPDIAEILLTNQSINI